MYGCCRGWNREHSTGAKVLAQMAAHSHGEPADHMTVPISHPHVQGSPLLLLPRPRPILFYSSLRVGLEKRGGRRKEAGSRQERSCNHHEGTHLFVIYCLIYLQSSQCPSFVKGMTQNTYIIMVHLTNNENKEEPGLILSKIGSLLEAQSHTRRPSCT